LPAGTSCCSGSAILGFYTPMVLVACGATCWCYSCLNCAIPYIMCPTTPVLFNGIQCDCFRFTYYGNDNLRFIPRYDTGLGKWTSTFDTHCKNFYCCCIVYTLCGTPCCSFNFNN
jgi:hypothetical protein